VKWQVDLHDQFVPEYGELHKLAVIKKQKEKERK